MSIHDYKPETAEVEFKGGSLTVRGLALDDVAVLMRSHLVDLDKLIGIYQSEVNDAAAVASFAQYALALAREAPGLVANIIALSCDEPEHVDKFRKLSIPITTRAVEKIIQLTFEEAGGPKKFVESLMQMIRGMRAPKTDSLT
jgi:hypothetical protein